MIDNHRPPPNSPPLRSRCSNRISTQRVCQGERQGRVPRRLPPAQGGAEAGEGDEWLHELDLQSRYSQQDPNTPIILKA